MSAISFDVGRRALGRRDLRALATALAVAILGLIAAFALTRTTDQPATAALATAADAAPGASSGIARSAESWAAVPLPAQLAISRAIGADQPEYRITSGVARLERQGLRADFNVSGVDVVATGRPDARPVSATLGLRGPAVTPIVHGNRAVYDRGAVSEWYANGPLGLEQGFTLTRSAPHTLTLAGGGSLHPQLRSGASGVDWVGRHGRAVIRESGLSAWDADGRQLPVRFVLRPHRPLRIHLDATGAAFPVTVDPIIQSAKLTASDGYNGEGQGATVNGNGISAGGLGSSVSIDGSTIAVGAPGAAVTYGPDLSQTYPSGVTNSYQGAVYVFSEPANGWADATETAKLFASDGLGAGKSVNSGQNVYGDALGTHVVISGDTIVTAAPRAQAGGQDYAGDIYVFTKPSGGWVTSFQTAELAANNATRGDQLGQTLGFDGQTIAASVSRYGSSYQADALYVFTKPASGGWVNSAQPAAQINDPAGAHDDAFGAAPVVAGATIAVGAPESTVATQPDAGAVDVFTRSGATWGSSVTTATLTAATPLTNEALGNALAIDGNTLVAGASHSVSGNGVASTQGAAYVFSNSGAWSSATQARLTASDGAAYDGFGNFVAVAGSSVSVTGYPGGTPTLYGFTEPATGWTTSQQSSETPLTGASALYQGSLAIQNGTIVAGTPGANAGTTQGAGAALVLTTGTATTPGGTTTITTSTTGTNSTPTSSTPTTPVSVPSTQNPAPSGPALTFTSTPVFTDTTTADDIIAGLFGIKPGSGETVNLGDFTFVAYCNKPQGQCAAGTSFGQQLGTHETPHLRRAGLVAVTAAKAKAVIWGSGTMKIKAGQHAKVRVKLNALGRKLLARHHVLRGQLKITLSSGPARVHAFTLRYVPRAKARPKGTSTATSRSTP